MNIPHRIGAQIPASDSGSSPGGFARWRLRSLICLMAIEIILIVSLRNRGWVETTESTRWLLTVTAAVLPLLVAVLLFVSSWRKLRLRTLFIGIAAICVFLSVSLTPLVAIRQSRLAAKALLDADAELGAASAGDHDDESHRRRFTVASDIPGWLRPLATKWEAVPHDREIVSVDLSSEDEIDVFIQQFARLPNLRAISVHSHVLNAGLKKLAAVAEQLPRVNALSVAITATSGEAIRDLRAFTGLRWLLVSGVEIPADGWFDQFKDLETLYVWDEGQLSRTGVVTVRLRQGHVDSISRLSKLKHLRLTGLNLQALDLLGLQQPSKLREVGLIGCRNANPAQLKLLREHFANRGGHLYVRP